MAGPEFSDTHFVAQKYFFVVSLSHSAVSLELLLKNRILTRLSLLLCVLL